MAAWLLGTLALKTFSKPIANYLTKEADCHPIFRRYIINLAQASHRLERRVQRRIYDYAADDIPIQPLDENKAVGIGVDLLKEFFVLTVAGSAVIFEVSEARKKEERRRLKEERRRQENELLRQEIELLRQENELLRQDNKLLRRELQLIQELQLRQENEVFELIFN